MKFYAATLFSLVLLTTLRSAEAGHLSFLKHTETSLQTVEPAVRGSEPSALQLAHNQVPPPLPLGPAPQLVWIENTPLPTMTLPPLPEQCFACRCLMIYPGTFLDGGNVGNDYSCHGGAATKHVPEIHWASEIQDSLRYQEMSSGTCPDCMSFAVTMEDLDYPYGVGESNNGIRSLFWAVNIPPDWRSLNQSNAFSEDDGAPVVTIGQNSVGKMEMETPCPHKGTHRYRVTLWALRSQLGTRMDPVNPDMDYFQLVSQLEQIEMARASFVGSLKSAGAMPGQASPSFIQGVSGFAR